MPEIAEVETVRRELAGVMTGGVIREVREGPAANERMWQRGGLEGGGAEAEKLLREWEGRGVVGLGRRGKLMWITGDHGEEGNRHIGVHLGMSGWWLVRGGGTEQSAAAATGADRHVRLVIAGETEGLEWVALFVDPRRFGWVGLWDDEDLKAATYRLGPDALEDRVRGAGLKKGAAGRSRALKAHLLDQSVLAGLGNIYADEVAWAAGVNPVRSVATIEAGEWESLAREVRPVVRAGLARGGATLADGGYRRTDGEYGQAQGGLAVHTREGEECRRCGEAIERVRVVGRSTYFCPGCQR